jgi:site-specific recombinase
MNTNSAQSALMSPTPDAALQALLESVDAQAPLAQRHLWLIQMIAWLRGEEQSVPDVLRRLASLAHALETQPAHRAALSAWWLVLQREVDARTLLAEHGFSQHSAFLSALSERLRRKLLPATPETRDPVELFMLTLNQAFDAQWLAAVDAPLAQRLLDLLRPVTQAQEEWRTTYADAITFCISQVRAVGFSSEVRTRMPESGAGAQPFHALDLDFDAVRAALLAPHSPHQAQTLADAVAAFRVRLEACRAAASSVYAGLADQGISVGLVFRLRELRERLLRIRELLDIALGDNPAQATCRDWRALHHAQPPRVPRHAGARCRWWGLHVLDDGSEVCDRRFGPGRFLDRHVLGLQLRADLHRDPTAALDRGHQTARHDRTHDGSTLEGCAR